MARAVRSFESYMPGEARARLDAINDVLKHHPGTSKIYTVIARKLGSSHQSWYDCTTVYERPEEANQ